MKKRNKYILDTNYWLKEIREKSDSLLKVPKHLMTEEFCISAVQLNGYALCHIPEPQQTEAICLAAVKCNGDVLEFVRESLRTEIVCFAAVQKNGIALMHVPKSLRTEIICLYAVQNYGRALRYVPDVLKTGVMCLIAVQQNGYAIQYVPELLRTETMYSIANQTRGVLEFIPEQIIPKIMDDEEKDKADQFNCIVNQIVGDFMNSNVYRFNQMRDKVIQFEKDFDNYKLLHDDVDVRVIQHMRALRMIDTMRDNFHQIFKIFEVMLDILKEKDNSIVLFCLYMKIDEVVESLKVSIKEVERVLFENKGKKAV